MYLSLLALLMPFLLALAPLTGMPAPHNPSTPPASVESAEDFRIASGVYTCPNDGSTLKIAPLFGESHSVEISLYRLTFQEGTGVYENDMLVVSAEDAAGGIMIWHITKNGESLRAEVYSSTWSLLPEGTVFEFKAE